MSVKPERLNYVKDIIYRIRDRYRDPSDLRLTVDYEWLIEVIAESISKNPDRLAELLAWLIHGANEYPELSDRIRDARSAMWLDQVIDPPIEQARRIVETNYMLYGMEKEPLTAHFGSGRVHAVTYSLRGRFGFLLRTTTGGELVIGRVIVPPFIAVASCQCPRCHSAPTETCETENNRVMRFVSAAEISPAIDPVAYTVHICPRCDLRWVCTEGAALW